MCKAELVSILFGRVKELQIEVANIKSEIALMPVGEQKRRALKRMQQVQSKQTLFIKRITEVTGRNTK